jgi:hypothetical protein
MSLNDALVESVDLDLQRVQLRITTVPSASTP